MIERYNSPAIASVFSDYHRYQLWGQVGMAALDSQAAAGIVPSDDVDRIKHRLEAVIWTDVPGLVDDEERLTRHDVAAFVNVMGENLGLEAARWWHFGLTSSDVVDTALALQLEVVAGVITHEASKLTNRLATLAVNAGSMVTVGRTHGQHAIPMPVAHRFEVWYELVSRAVERFHRAAKAARVGKLSGPVGFNNDDVMPRWVEHEALKRLGLGMVASTQVVPRDLHVDYVYGLCSITNALEQVALDIRLLSQTEIGELIEPRANQQMGSSSMPHKTNPINCERVCGLAGLMRGYLSTMMQSQALWNERDISHSSVERVALPDATAVAHHCIETMNRVLVTLQIRPPRVIPGDTAAAVSHAVVAGAPRLQAWQQNQG